MQLNINEELKKLIPKLQEEEIKLLEKSVIKEGCRDSLIIWDNTIIDGHNRYEICTRNNIDFEVEEMKFENIGQVKKWMIDNQLARRNLTDSQRRYFIGKRYEEENLGHGGSRGVSSAQNEHLKTAEAIAEENNTSQATVRRNADYSKAIDNIQKEAPEIAEKILSEEIRLSNKDVLEVSKTEPEQRKKVYEEISKGIPFKEAYKDIRKSERKENLAKEMQELAEQELEISGKIINDDLFNAIRDIEDKSIDLLFVDPPYAILKEEWDNVDIAEFTEKWLIDVMPKVKDSGRVYVSFSHAYMFELYKILESNDNFGFNFGQVLIWQYRNNNKPSDRKMYRHAYEPIFYLYGKDAEPLNFTADTYGEVQNTVWTIATPQSNFKEGKHHPAQKPLELLERIIKTGSKQGDLILDPFAGSGTTGVVCENLKRDYILIEKDDEYVNIIKGRLNELERKDI